jgi:hypothetical protein
MVLQFGKYMTRSTFFTLSMLLATGLLVGGAPGASAAKAPNEVAPANDRIEVIGHLAFDGKGVTSVTTGEHWRKNYLYVNFDGKITVVDVTGGAKPTIASEYNGPSASNAQLVVGNVALLTDAQPVASNIPHSISIVSFANPAKPEVVRQFTNITGFLVDTRRGLIHVVNNEGLWILQEKPGRDLELEKQYERELKYNH